MLPVGHPPQLAISARARPPDSFDCRTRLRCSPAEDDSKRGEASKCRRQTGQRNNNLRTLGTTASLSTSCMLLVNFAEGVIGPAQLGFTVSKTLIRKLQVRILVKLRDESLNCWSHTCWNRCVCLPGGHIIKSTDNTILIMPCCKALVVIK